MHDLKAPGLCVLSGFTSPPPCARLSIHERRKILLWVLVLVFPRASTPALGKPLPLPYRALIRTTNVGVHPRAVKRTAAP